MTEATGTEAAEPNTQTPLVGDRKKTWLERVKDFKELVAILIFFGGGGIWLYNYFATKDQLNQFRCLAMTHLDILRKEKKMERLMVELTELDEKRKAAERIPDTPSKTRELVQASAKAELIRKDMMDTSAEIGKANDVLQKNLCSTAGVPEK